MFNRTLTNRSSQVAIGIATLVLGAAAARAQTGACCLPPGPPALTTQPCIQTDMANCISMGGTYLGDNTMCTSPSFAAPSSCVSVNMETGQNGAPNGGQVNISGATLFQNFFLSPASTNADALPPNGLPANGRMVSNNQPVCNDSVPYAGFFPNPCPGVSPTNQLARTFACAGTSPNPGPYYWIVQYRGSGSVEGFTEFVDYQLLGMVPNYPPVNGWINRLKFWDQTTGLQLTCRADANGDGNTNDNTGTPVVPSSIDIAVADVPSTMVVVGPGTGADAKWNRKPTQTGYGLNPRLSTGGLSSLLASLSRGNLSLNQNNNPPVTPAPDANTIYDSTVAWVPIAAIANRGVNRANIRYTELQYLFVTGRMPNGENLQAVTRDVGSGTRNGFENSVGIDPSQGVGDNLGPRANFTQMVRVGIVPAGGTYDLPAGSRTQPTNCGGSGVLNEAVKVRRLAIGFQGAFGGNANSNQRSGNYEVLAVAKDVDDNGDPIPGFTPSPQTGDPAGASCPNPPANNRPSNNGYVLPTPDTVFDNADPLLGYQIGGLETAITRGDPNSGLSGNTNPAISNLNARDYVRNIVYSIANFVTPPTTQPTDPNNMPGQYLAFNFALVASVDRIPDIRNPTRFINNPFFLQSIQDFARCNQVASNTPLPYGSVNVAGIVPFRNTRVGFGGTYSDGSTNGNYTDFSGAYTVTNAMKLNGRNRVSGDFNNDGQRDLGDAAQLMAALKDRNAYVASQGFSAGTGGGSAGTPTFNDFVIPEIIGDFDGDGNFDSLDARYFADGLAIDPSTGQLDRKKGFIAVDTEWSNLGMGNNYFGTTLATGAAYKAGDSRGDVAGSSEGPYRGAFPNGNDGTVNAVDINYVYANFGSWKTLNQAAKIDLSCDMTGDLIVDQRDVDELVFAILCTRYGDVNLNGIVDATDRGIILANDGQTGLGWAGGDINGDGIVNALDLALCDANIPFNGPSCAAVLCGDINADGVVNNADVALFTQATLAQTTDTAILGRSDVDSNPPVSGTDVQKFVCCLLNGGNGSACP